ncbi:IS110 family transposase [Phyllobacterium sp. LjRoot231]|uniref:IS110 family transposase n=1 Tax=Phyllobacterium sp. LjRoot231 TaxID=3342289 RepID=UPI003ECDA32C
MEINIIGLDLAKNVFHAHGADASGAVLFSKQLRRNTVLEFFARQSPCTVAMEACGGAHYWAREIGKQGHTVRLIPPKYVKPFVKRQKNDAADAQAICEAAQRPTMRFVAVKSEDQQANAAVFRARDLLVRQRTQLINALRGQLTEYGWIVARGPSHVARLIEVVKDPASDVPQAAREVFAILAEAVQSLDERIKKFDAEIGRRAKVDEVVRRLMTIPGIGPITATALAALAPDPATFRKGRDFAAWVGLTPLQHSTGGKQKIGRTSKMGERTLRRLLIIGACAVVKQASAGRGAPKGSWLARMIASKPRMLVVVSLANKMARIVWALMAKGEVYKAPTVTV